MGDRKHYMRRWNYKSNDDGNHHYFSLACRDSGWNCQSLNYDDLKTISVGRNMMSAKSFYIFSLVEYHITKTKLDTGATK